MDSESVDSRILSPLVLIISIAQGEQPKSKEGGGEDRE
jgi:hypothetical protein